MPTKAIIQQYNALVKKFNYQDRWRKGYYSGYERNSFLEMRGYNEDLLDITGDSQKEIRQKINALKTITKKGDQQLQQLSSGDYWSKTSIKTADDYLSKLNQEHQAMSEAFSGTTSEYLYKDKQGNLKIRKGEKANQEIQYILNMGRGAVYYVEGYGTLGEQLPSKKRNETKEEYELRIKEYKKWLNSRNIDRYNLSTQADFFRHKGKFRESSQKLAKERMHTLHLNIKNALFNKVKGSITFENSRTKTLKKYLNTMTDKDVLYLFSTRQDLFDFSFLYSSKELDDKVEKLITAIENFRDVKKGYRKTPSGEKIELVGHDSYEQWSKAIDRAYGK